jgi:hypothetical protein
MSYLEVMGDTPAEAVEAHKQRCCEAQAAYNQALAAHELRQQQWLAERARHEQSDAKHGTSQSALLGVAPPTLPQTRALKTTHNRSQVQAAKDAAGRAEALVTEGGTLKALHDSARAVSAAAAAPSAENAIAVPAAATAAAAAVAAAAAAGEADAAVATEAVAAKAAKKGAWLAKMDRVQQHAVLCAGMRAEFEKEAKRVLDHNRRCSRGFIACGLSKPINLPVCLGCLGLCHCVQQTAPFHSFVCLLVRC